MLRHLNTNENNKTTHKMEKSTSVNDRKIEIMQEINYDQELFNYSQLPFNLRISWNQ